MKIGIIGGGASGLVAAIKAKNTNNEVIIFERNKECGKKILATGNGRCNYWNSDQDLKHYESNNKELIKELINFETEKEVLSLFDKLGIVPRIKNGYYYPFSNQASAIRNVLLNEVIKLGVKINYEFLVTDIKKVDNKFIIISDSKEEIVDKLIIASGSKAASKTGSDGMGYSFLEKFNHTIIRPLPALVKLVSDSDILKKWDGIRTEVKLFLYENDSLVQEEEGEIQLTNYGISGICVFNLSNRVSRGLSFGKKEIVKINFLPFLIDVEKLTNWFNEKTNLSNKCVKDLLLGVLHPNLVDILIKDIDYNCRFDSLKDSDKATLLENILNYRVNIIKTKDYSEAQVCSGGVMLSEINLKTMESLLVKDLYIIGELLDLTGECGGYNLGIAFRSGLVAGQHIGGQND